MTRSLSSSSATDLVARCLTVLAAIAVAAVGASGQERVAIHNDQTRLEALGNPGHWTGVAVISGGQEVTRVELSSAGRWTASRAQTGGGGEASTLTLGGLATAGTGGTPDLAPSSFVRFTLRRDDPFPRVDFRLDLRAFDRGKWQAAWSEPCPMYFLRCSSPDPELYYFHGLLAPTPKTDPYPFSFRDMRAHWADGWSTAPALAALTVPAVALWTPSTGHLVAYSFQHARSTDRSDKFLSVAYCWRGHDHPGQFFALIWPYQRGFQELTYPTVPATVESHFDLLYDLKTGPTGDVNRFILDHLWSRYRDLLPPVPQMNDLGWMVERNGIEEGLGGSGIFSRVHKATGSFAAMCFRDDTELFGGDFRGVDLAYRRGDPAELARLRQEVDRMLGRAQWETLGGEECVHWTYPSDGGWEEGLGGAAASTTHNVQQFGFAGAVLAMYLHEPSDRLWRVVEGCYHWARHCLYTRGDICDIPCSMFTLQTSQLALNFLMNLHYSLRDDPDPKKRALAQEAFPLAATIVWRNANVTTDDPDETDALDPSFLMPGNHALPWLGQVSWAELSDVFRSMIVMYGETGDPRFKYYVRGALDRWYTGFQADGYHTDENLDVFGAYAGKGVRSGTHGPQDSFSVWAQPVGDTIFHVTGGRAAAMAFCRGTTALDVGDYRFQEPRGFAFRITGTREQPFRMIFSSPSRDLSGLAVRVDGEPVGDVRVAGAYHEHLFFTAHAGATVVIGDLKALGPTALAEKPTAPAPEVKAWTACLGVEEFNLAPHCNTVVDQSWDRRESWAGLAAGRAFAYGVPYEIVDPETAGGRIGVQPAPGKGQAVVAVRHAADGLFLLCSKLAKDDVTVVLSSGVTVPVDPALGLLARTGRPLQRWELWLYPVAIPPNNEVDTLVLKGKTLLFALTAERSHQRAVSRVVRRVQEERQKTTAATEAEGVQARMELQCRQRVRAVLDKKLVRAALLPPHGTAAGVFRTALGDLGVAAVGLRPEELVDPALFRAADYPIAVYTGIEDYLRTVKQAGDGEAALLRYLREGGTLLVMGPCRPFTYADDLTAPVADTQRPSTLFGKQFGLDLLGPGEARGDALGFEQVPEGELAFGVEKGQTVLSGLPDSIPFLKTGDRRYRPAAGTGLPAGDEFTSMLTLRDQAGKRYGPAMALIRRHSAGFVGANILWVWGTLLSPDFSYSHTVLYQALTAAAEMCGPASETPALIAPAGPRVGATVGILPLTSAERGAQAKRLCAELSADCAEVPPDLFVDATSFSPERYPIALHGSEGEAFVDAWRLPGDGADAYLRYLRAGGFLIACGNATQFYYLADYADGAWRTRDPIEPKLPQDLGLPIEYGFERPPGQMRLELAAGQTVLRGLDQTTDVTGLRDQRWRALLRTRGAEVEFTPLAYLTDGDGNRYNGYAAALIRRQNPGHRPGTILYLWGNLLEGEVGNRILKSALQFAMKDVQGPG